MKKALLLTLFICNILSASSNSVFEHLGTNEGMSSSSINTIEKDSLGFMWFAMGNGANRFSGSDFSYYDISLQTDYIQDKNVSHIRNIDGILWATMRSGYLLKYDYLLDKFEVEAYKERNAFYDIFKLSSTTLLITGSSLHCYNTLNKELHETYFEDNNNFRTARVIGNRVYIGTDRGVYLFYLNQNSLVFGEILLPNIYIQTLDVHNNNLIVGTSEKGLYLLNQEGTVLNHRSFGYGENIQSIKCNDSLTYIGVNRVGLVVLDDNFVIQATYTHDTNSSSSLSINSIHDIYIDHEKRIWLSTYRKGVDILDPKEQSFKTNVHKSYQENSLHNNIVRSICEIKKNTLWFGTERGISSYDYENDKWYKLSFLENEAVLHIKRWKSNVIICTYGSGLIIVDPQKGSITQKYSSEEGVSDFIYNCFVDNKDRIWFASLDILYCLDEDFNLKEVSLTNVKEITQSKNGDIVVGSFQGIFRISETYSASQMFSQSLKNSLVWSILEDTNTLWVGTEGGGLKSINTETGNLKNIETVTSTMIFDIHKDLNNNLWLLTSDGVGKYDPNLEHYTIHNTSDNLPTNDFRLGRIEEASDGDFFVSSSYGSVQFNPNDIKTYSTSIDVYITNLEVSGNKYNQYSPLYLQDIKLKYNENSLSFTFEGLGFTNIEKSRYRWKMIGVDKDWVTSSNRTANYSNLSYGTYRLLYLASNSDGIWMEKPKELIITITPPLWATLGARIFYVLIFILLLWLILYFYKARIKRNLSEDKIRSFINIAHDINTMVSVIKLSTEKITSGMEQNSSVKILLQNSERLSNWASQLITFQKAERDNLRLKVEEIYISHFIDSIVMSFTPLTEHHKITIDTNIDPNSTLWFDKLLMERVINNLISNAIKYSQEGGKIEIISKENDSICRIAIKDEGIGIPKEEQREIFKRFYRADNINDVKNNTGSGVGLMLSKHIVRLHHGKIEFESQVGRGSTFFIHLEKGNSHYSNHQIITSENTEVELPTSKINLSEFAKKTILLIDDNDDFRFSLKTELNNVFNIIEARNGEEGLIKATQKMPDVIITDIMMPKISGSELCFQLKNDEATNHIPIIILTSLATTQDKVENIEYGADAYIEKPLNLKLLKLTLRNILKAQEHLKNYYNVYEKEGDKQHHKSPSTENAFMGKVASIVKLQLQQEESIDIDNIASNLGFSRSVLYRKIKAITGLSPAAFIQKIKLQYAIDLLSNSLHLSIKEVAFMCGYVNSKHFSVAFRKEFETTPTAFRNTQKTNKIRP